MSNGTKESCTCAKCREACSYRPGWFLPGEAEEVAYHLGVSLETLFETKLMVDWWVGDDADVFVLSPAIVGEEAGTETQEVVQGTCVFFENGSCLIHAVKPFECREMIHGEKNGERNGRHEWVANAWRSFQDQIVGLLGREPESKNFTLYDLFS